MNALLAAFILFTTGTAWEKTVREEVALGDALKAPQNLPRLYTLEQSAQGDARIILMLTGLFILDWGYGFPYDEDAPAGNPDPAQAATWNRQQFNAFVKERLTLLLKEKTFLETVPWSEELWPPPSKYLVTGLDDCRFYTPTAYDWLCLWGILSGHLTEAESQALLADLIESTDRRGNLHTRLFAEIHLLAQKQHRDAITIEAFRENLLALNRTLTPQGEAKAILFYALACSTMYHPLSCGDGFFVIDQSHTDYLWNWNDRDNKIAIRHQYAQSHAWITTALEAAESKTIKKLLNLLLEPIVQRELHFSGSGNWPQERATIEVLGKNIIGARFAIVPLTPDTYFDITYDSPWSAPQDAKAFTIPIPTTPRFFLNATSFTLPHPLSDGFYGIQATAIGSPKIRAIGRFQVSPLTLFATDISEPGDWQKTRFYVIDAPTGKPAEGATVEIISSKQPGTVLVSAATGADGTAAFSLAGFPDRYSLRARIRSGESQSYWTDTLPATSKPAPRETLRWFFNQPGYRPGQKIRAQGFISIQNESNEPQAVVGKTGSVITGIINGSEAGVIPFTTDSTGAFTIEATIPHNASDGWLSCEVPGIDSAYGHVWVSRENPDARKPPPQPPQAPEATPPPQAPQTDDSPFTFTTETLTCRVGETARFRWITPLTDATLRIEASDRHGSLFAQTLRAGSAETCAIPINERTRGGFHIQAILTDGRRTHTRRLTINVPWERTLAITPVNLPATFAAGEPQTVTIRISDSTARLTAALCDAALDAIPPNPDPDATSYLAAWHTFEDLFIPTTDRANPFYSSQAGLFSRGVDDNVDPESQFVYSMYFFEMHRYPLPAAAPTTPFKPSPLFRTGIACDLSGSVTLTFTAPKGRWRLNLLAYTENLSSAALSHLCEAL